MNLATYASIVFKSLLVPPVSLLMLALAGYLIARPRPRLGRAISRTALLALLIISTKAGAWLLVAPLENLEPPLLNSRQSGAQAIVVLSAGTLYNNPEYANQSIPDYIALGRIRYAAKLYRDTALPILVSGGLGDAANHQDSLALEMARVLEYEFAIPVRWQEDQSRTTRENAEYSARLLAANGIQHILLVTDAMHMRRSQFAFKQAGLQVTSAPTLFFSRDQLGILSLLPSAEGLRRSHYAVHEWLGLLWYQLAGR